MIKLLDCTLRDGGYLNDWMFGKDNIDSIINNLSHAGIEYIECGFLENIAAYNHDKTFFKDSSILSSLNVNTNICLMLNYGIDITDFIFDRAVEIRLAFKQNHLSEIEKFTQDLISKGLRISLNPMHIGLYSEEELDLLTAITNRLHPVCLTATDTMGIMQEWDVEKIFYILDENVHKDIPLGFHSHDNLELSFKNIRVLSEMDLSRDIIIDTSINGLGRGGGMPNTEAIAEYLNNTYDKNYNLSKIKEASTYVQSIKKEDKYPYYLSAQYKCHPNYAKYCIEKNISTDKIEIFLKNIPAKSKTFFSREIAESILRKYLNLL